MNNAKHLYNSIVEYSDIEKLIGDTESIIQEFKTSSSTNGKANDDDKENLLLTISGFSHSIGGVLIWGIECKPDGNGKDRAKTLKPIPNIDNFASTLLRSITTKIIPLPEIEHKIIKKQNDDTEGFLIIHVPETTGVFVIQGTNNYVRFYKRFGESSQPMISPQDIQHLFNRKLIPNLDIDFILEQDTIYNVKTKIIIKNIGMVPAKNIEIEIVPKNIIYGTFYDGGGNQKWETWHMETTGEARKIFHHLRPSLHPQSVGTICNAYGYTHEKTEIPDAIIECTIYAENMEPKKISWSPFPNPSTSDLQV